MKSKSFSKKTILFAATLTTATIAAISSTKQVSATVSNDEMRTISTLSEFDTMALRFQCNGDEISVNPICSGGDGFYLKKGDIIALTGKSTNYCHEDPNRQIIITRTSDLKTGQLPISTFMNHMTKITLKRENSVANLSGLQ